MKKSCQYLAIILALLFLVGCAGGGANTPTSTPTPIPTATPAPTPTPEPPHEHIWVEASCQKAKTCNDCGETEGNPLPHELTEASFQEAPVCTVCGETVGDPLMPYFVEKGYNINMAVGITNKYKTITFNDSNWVNIDNSNKDSALPIIGNASITDYTVIDSDDAREAKDGYEWRIAQIYLNLDDDNARDYGWYWSAAFADYYTGLFLIEDTGTFNITYNNSDYECELVFKVTRSETVGTGDKSYPEREFEVSIQVPVGYDGFVIIFYNSKYTDIESFEIMGYADYVAEIKDDDTLFFRFH